MAQKPKKTAAKAKKTAKAAKAKKVNRQPEQMELPGTAPSEVDTNTLVPGYLIGLKTAVKGNVKYDKQVVEPEHRLRSGAEKVKWETERTIDDPEEHKKANQTRMKVRALICSECVNTEFGLLCPEKNVQRLDLAVVEAKKVVATFNRTSRLSKVRFGVLKGRIAHKGVEAMKAIKGEVRELLTMMSEGVRNLDVEAVREAASKARSIGAMLGPDAAGTLSGAVATAREAARKIAKVAKAGETVAGEIDREAVKKLTQARTAFLDIDEGEGVEVASPVPESRALDLEPGEVEPIAEGGARTGRARRTPVTEEADA